jgi:hypothetical protein
MMLLVVIIMFYKVLWGFSIDPPYFGYNYAEQVTRVNSANVLDEGLMIGGRGHRMNSKVKVNKTRRDYACIENKRGTQLSQSQSIPAGLSWPLYIGGQVSRIRSGLIQITVSIYDINSYFNYAYDWAYLNGR